MVEAVSVYFIYMRLRDRSETRSVEPIGLSVRVGTTTCFWRIKIHLKRVLIKIDIIDTFLPSRTKAEWAIGNGPCPLVLL